MKDLTIGFFASLRTTALLLFISAPLAAAPKLIVIVVVDQMRADYLDRFQSEYQYGFKTLLAKSRRYTQARLNYVPTETAPGHATIATGRPPGMHGIIGNDWYDRDSGKTVVSVVEPSGDIGPARLLVDTIGDAIKKKDRESKVVAVSYKDRAAVFLGGKHPDACVWFDRALRRFVSSPAYKTSGDWLVDYAKSQPPRKEPPAGSAETDRRILRMAEELMRRYDLGRDDHPDLLAISFSATDFIGHAYGPNSPRIHQQMLDLDKIIGTLLDDATRADNGVAIVLTSDHGVSPIPETRKDSPVGAKRVLLRSLHSALEAMCQKIFSAPGRTWVLGTFVPDVYLNRALADELKLDWSTVLARFATGWRAIPGVAMVYLNNPLIAQDQFSPIYDRSDCPGRSGDLFVRMQEGVLVTSSPFGTSHGSPYDDDARVPILFYGKDFSAETIDKSTDNEFIAPTLANLIGVDF